VSAKYTPSKVCPHRFCRVLHEIAKWGSLVVALTGTTLALQIGAVLAILLTIYTWRMNRRYKLPPLRYERPNPYLQVRRWWARAAVVGDVAVVLLVLLCIAGNAAMRAAGAHAGAVDLGALTLGSVIGAAAFGLVIWCHYMATRPAKPKRVRVPSNAAFQGVG
jgi:membrane protein implicated in regulation of membrane protease activity